MSRICPFCGRILLDQRLRINDLAVAASGENAAKLLNLTVPFHELHDPKELAKDVTNLGRWGNGDVEVGLSEAEDVPYIMGLVRQAFEKQMGDAEVEP